MYVIVAIESASEFPGALASWGPFSTYESASIAADGIAAINNVKRGEEIQVVRLQNPNEFGDVRIRFLSDF